MNNTLNSINLYIETFQNTFNISSLTLILFLILIIIIIFQQFSIKNIKKTLKISSSINLNNKIVTEITRLNKEMDELNVFKSSCENSIGVIKNYLRKVKQVKMIKYNPYADMGVGGNQSFSLSLIDENGDGIILTSLYSREKSRSLIKNVKNFVPESELTPEEKQILDSLKNNI